jgi:pyruvate formate lyase activating enzyme
LGGLHKTSTLDFPGCLSAVLFVRGCNFICPYCHNPGLLSAEPASPPLDWGQCLEFLAARRRRQLLQGVVISGGEPTINDDLPDLCARLKAMGYQVKLDTNGSRPHMLKQLLQAQLLDYVAMDIKTLPRLYHPDLSREHTLAPALEESMLLLQSHALPHEFRTTMVSPFVSPALAPALIKLLPPGARWYLQPARLAPASAQQALSRETIARIRDLALNHGIKAAIRGEDNEEPPGQGQ